MIGSHVNEKMMQEIIGKYPSAALGEEGLVLFDREVKIANRRLDIVLKDSKGCLVLLDVQKGPLASGKIDQHKDFCMEFSRSNPYFHIRIMFVANHIGTLQKEFFHRVGYEFRELSQKQLEEIAEKYELLHKDRSMSNFEKQNIQGHSEKKDAIKILILEDDQTSGQLLTNLLKPYGNCDLVTDGKSAVEFFQKAIRDNDGYKLILVDNMAPETLGHDVVRIIREMERNAETSDLHSYAEVS